MQTHFSGTTVTQGSSLYINVACSLKWMGNILKGAKQLQCQWDTSYSRTIKVHRGLKIWCKVSQLRILPGTACQAMWTVSGEKWICIRCNLCRIVSQASYMIIEKPFVREVRHSSSSDVLMNTHVWRPLLAARAPCSASNAQAGETNNYGCVIGE